MHHFQVQPGKLQHSKDFHLMCGIFVWGCLSCSLTALNGAHSYQETTSPAFKRILHLLGCLLYFVNYNQLAIGCIDIQHSKDLNIILEANVRFSNVAIDGSSGNCSQVLLPIQTGRQRGNSQLINKKSASALGLLLMRACYMNIVKFLSITVIADEFSISQFESAFQSFQYQAVYRGISTFSLICKVETGQTNVTLTHSGGDSKWNHEAL